MPKMFVHTRARLLTTEARSQVAKALTELGMECERLADTAKVRNGIWVSFTDHAGEQLFQGGQVATDPIASVIVFALQGGLDAAMRRKLIAGITAILGSHIAPGGNPAPVYVAIRDVPEASWGMYGEQVSLASLREGA